MQDRRRARTWLSWLMVTVLGFALISGFVLVGGLGTEQSGVALAGNSRASSTSASSATVSSDSVSSQVASISTSVCAGPTVTGSLLLNAALTGNITLGLFALSQHRMPLARSFTDTGQRVTVSFSDAVSGQFRFPVVPSGAVDYLIAVIPGSGTVTTASQLAESAVVPLCGTRQATVITTVTTSEMSTATNTVTVILTETVTQTTQAVTTINPCLASTKAIAHAKRAASTTHDGFSLHIRQLAKKTFSANFKFTGLTNRPSLAICFDCCRP